MTSTPKRPSPREMAEFRWKKAPVEIPELSERDLKNFWARVNRTDSCWLWTGVINHEYGLFSLRGNRYRAHRVSFTLAKGKIPSRLVIDHMCKVKNCVNPEHLRAVDLVTNVMENSDSPSAAFKARDKCENGHELTGRNLFIESKSNGATFRRCRVCRAARMRAFRAKKRA